MADDDGPVIDGSRDDDHRSRRRDASDERMVERFKISSKGLRRVFGKHFPECARDVETLVYHLASLEAKQPMTKKAIRLARYPGAGDRDPRRFAMGLWENLSVLDMHLRRAMDSLENLAREGNGGSKAGGSKAGGSKAGGSKNGGG